MPVCNLCGSDQVVRSGRLINRAGIWQMYNCKKCGHRFKGDLL